MTARKRTARKRTARKRTARKRTASKLTGTLGSVVVLAGALAGCSAAADGPRAALAAASAPVQAGAPSAAPAASGPAAVATCTPGANASYPPLGSLPAPGAMPPGSLQAVIARRKLVVGVSGDTRLLGARNSLAGGVLEGFDIDIARAVARAIFGPDDVDSHIQWKVITAGQRFELVNKGAGTDGNAGGVDMVARAFSTTCDRWAQTDPTKGSAFSVGYFRSAQKILIRSDLRTTTGTAVGSINDLTKVAAFAGRPKVCAPAGSTSLANVQKIAGVVPVSVEIHSDCLALWQEGQVAAITGDDAILAGFAAQDHRAAVVGPALDTTNYALAISRSHKEFVQFVNAVLASTQGRAAWSAAYQAWLARPLPGLSQPEPDYGRTLA